MAQKFSKCLEAFRGGFLNLWVNPFTEIFFRQKQFHALDVFTDFSKSAMRTGAEVRVFGIFAGNSVEQEGFFFNS